MGKDSSIFDKPVEEEKLDPVYQGGYTDGYEAGEQYGYLSGWNEANEATIARIKKLLSSELSDSPELSEWAESELRKLKRETTQ